MSQFKRQHPVAAITRALNIIKQNAITIIIVFFMGRSTSGIWSNALSVTAIIGLLLVVGFISWWRYIYRIEEGELKIEYGLFVRKKIYIPRERIQVIDTSSGFIQRLFGLVSLKIRTASGEGGATLEALSKEEASAISDQLSLNRSDKPEERPTDLKRNESPVFKKRIETRELLVSAATSGSIGIIATILGSISSELDTLLSNSQIYNFLENLIGSGWQMLLVLAVGLLLISVFLAFIGTLVKYARFSVERRGENIIIERGLIERKTISIPLNRIQAIRIDENLFRQPLGRCSVSVSSAGYGDEDGKVTTLFPLLPTEQLHAFLEQFVPAHAKEIPAVAPPPVARRRYIFRKIMVAAVIGAILYILTGWLWFFLLIIPAAWFGNAQYNSAAVGIRKSILAARYRLISRKTVIVLRRRIQAVEVRQTPFQKYNNLVNLSVYMASGNSGHTAAIRELEKRTGLAVQHWLAHKTGEDTDLLFPPSSNGIVLIPSASSDK